MTMVDWIKQVPEVVVGDLVANKQVLVDVSATTNIAQTLEVLNNHRILSCPVYGKKGSWIGAGGVNLCIGDKQYIGIISVIDILAFMFRNKQLLLRERLSTPITQVVGETDESLCLWVEPVDRPLLYACEMLGKGVHRVLVTDGSSARLLTQTDVVKFIATHSRALPHLSSLFAKQVRDVARAARPEMKHIILYVELHDSLKMAVSLLLEHKITALPVVDHHGSLQTQISISDFRGMLSTALAAIQSLTVHEYLMQTHRCLPPPIVCRDTDSVNDAVQKMLSSRIHRIWINTENRGLSLLTFTDVIAAAFQSEL